MSIRCYLALCRDSFLGRLSHIQIFIILTRANQRWESRTCSSTMRNCLRLAGTRCMSWRLIMGKSIPTSCGIEFALRRKSFRKVNTSSRNTRAWKTSVKRSWFQYCLRLDYHSKVRKRGRRKYSKRGTRFTFTSSRILCSGTPAWTWPRYETIKRQQKKQDPIWQIRHNLSTRSPT